MPRRRRDNKYTLHAWKHAFAVEAVTMLTKMREIWRNQKVYLKSRERVAYALIGHVRRSVASGGRPAHLPEGAPNVQGIQTYSGQKQTYSRLYFALHGPTFFLTAV